MGRRSRTEIELDDDSHGGHVDGVDSGDVDVADGGAPRPPAAALRWRPSRRRVVAGAVVVAVLAVGTAAVLQVREAADERDRLAHLATLPQVVAPLDGPPRVLRTGPRELMGATARTPQGLLVTAVLTDDGAAVARAVDPATGDVGWERTLLAADEVSADARASTERSGGYCQGSDADPTALVCMASDAYGVFDEVAPRFVPATVTRLLVLDTADGTVAADLSDVVGASWTESTFTVVGDLVVASGIEDGTGQVVAVAPDGTVAWRTSLPAGEPAERRHDGAVGALLDVRPLDGGVAVATWDEVLLLDATGETLRREELGPEERVAAVAGTTVLVDTGPGRYPLGREDGQALAEGDGTRALGVDGEATLAGAYVPPVVDDGSADVVLTSGLQGLHAWDPDGRRLWSADELGFPSAAAVLGGRVHVVLGQEIVTLDAREGTELWRYERVVPDNPFVTDGRVLVARAPGASGEPGDGTSSDDMVAIAVDDGREVWRAPWPEQVDFLDGRHGSLLGWSFTDDGEDWGVSVLG